MHDAPPQERLSRSTASQSTPGPTKIQVGRQAIFDRNLDVFAYELLYRDEEGRCIIHDGDEASSTTLLHAFMEIGLDRLTGPHKAFMNLTRHFFVETPPIPFPQNRVVLEVLEDVKVDDALLDGISERVEQGYQIAMDDYCFQPELAPILPLVQYIKVEIQPDGLDRLARRMPELRATGARLLAEKVETAEQFERLHALGFEYFQGFFFARPKLVQSDRMTENSAVLIRLLALLNDPAASVESVVDLVRQDAALSFKVLRYVNSAGTGLATPVESIQHAVMLMGLKRIRAWATLFVMARLSTAPAEVLNLGLVRGNVCERLCRVSREGEPETAYTVGLLSVLDAMLSRPIEDLLTDLPLPDDVKRAIGASEGTYGDYLERARHLERSDFSRALRPGISPAELFEVYASSAQAAFEMLRSFDDD